MRAQILILKSAVENKKKFPEFTAPELELMFAHRESGWLSTISPHARFELSKHQRRKNMDCPTFARKCLDFVQKFVSLLKFDSVLKFGPV